MNYLVTGGTGNWGNYATRLLINEGHKVVVYQRNPLKARIEDLLDHLGKELIIVPGDTRDMALIPNLSGQKVTRIIHLANKLGGFCQANPIEATAINCSGTFNVFEIAKLLGMEMVVYASSGTTFGTPDKYEKGPIPDNAAQYPASVYSGTKAYQEVIAAQYLKQWGLDSIGLRPGSVYSYARTDGTGNLQVQELLMKPAMGQPGKITITPEPSNWHYAEDAARAAIMASKAGKTKTKVFNINGDNRSWDDTLAFVYKLLPDAKLTITRATAGTVHLYDGIAAKKEIGYEPIWTMEKGFEQVVKDARAGKM